VPSNPTGRTIDRATGHGGIGRLTRFSDFLPQAIKAEILSYPYRRGIVIGAGAMQLELGICTRV
jgi:hypothetical protein